MAAEALEPFVCGGLSAMLGSAVVQPQDVLKVRQMTSVDRKQSAAAVARAIYRAQGARGFYSGLSAALVRQSTYGTARIGLHRVISDALVRHNDGRPIPFYQKAASGMLSGALAVCVGAPFDIALVRMQTDGALPAAERRGYRHVFDAVGRIAREEGVARLWRGLAPNMLRGMAMNAGMMASYDQSKELVTTYVTRDPKALSTSLLSSAVAGVACAAASQPFEVIKSRLMNMRADPATGKPPYSGIIDCATKLVRNEGATGFLKGFPAYYARCAPHAMVILLTNERITRTYRWALGVAREHHDHVTALRFHSAGAIHHPDAGDGRRGGGAAAAGAGAGADEEGGDEKDDE